ncbi:MAG: glycosyltransferase family 9 protein [Planctomycetota bacterium]
MGIAWRLRALKRPNRRARFRAWRRGVIGRRRYFHAGVANVGLIEHFGDIVACEPIARYLHEKHGQVAWSVRSVYRKLVDRNPHIAYTIECETLTEWMMIRQGMDVPVDLHINRRWCDPTGNEFHKDDHGSGIDRTNYYDHGNLLAIACKSAGLPVLTEGPRVYLNDADRAAVDGLGLPPRFVAVHCRSNQAKRDWDDDKWRQLVDRLDVPVVEVGLQSVLGGQEGRVCGRVSLLETAEVIQRANLFIGIDSGPAHLANAVQTPGVILLGRYNQYAKYMPYSGGYGDGTNAAVIQHEAPAADIAVKTVLAHAKERIRG